MKISEKTKERLSAGLLVLLAVVVVISVGSVIYREALRFPEQERAFRVEAEAYLGTSDFTLTLEDGVLYARTDDGRRYPTDEMMAPYWTGRWTILGIMIAVLCVLAICSLFPVGNHARKWC